MPHAHFCPDCRRAWSHARMACPYYRVEDNGVRMWTEGEALLCRDCAEAP